MLPKVAPPMFMPRGAGVLVVALCSPLAVTDGRFGFVICACGTTAGSTSPTVLSVASLAPMLLFDVALVAPTAFGEVSPSLRVGLTASGVVAAPDVAHPPFPTTP